MANLKLNYIPRAPFIDFHKRKTRWAAMVCHRRAGKTVSVVHDLVLKACQNQGKNPKYGYIGPFRQQAKDIAWMYLKEATENLRKGPPRESDLKVTLFNGATIQIYGADNPESFRGLYFDGVVLDEYQHFRPSIWGEIILPTLIDRQGWAVFIGTMQGKNHFWKTLEKAKKTDNWFHMELKGSESGILTPEDLAELRAEMTEPQYEQEIECNPNAAVLGTYYSDLIVEIEKNNQITHVPHDDTQQVHVAADLGFTDSTAFWFWQMDSDGPRMIDYYEADSQPLSHYFQVLREKGYDYADIWLPHDAKAKSFQTGRSTIEQFLEQGFPCKPVPKLAVQHGIDAARLMIPAVRFDAKKCYQGLECLRAYRRTWNDKTQQFSNAPLHDWASNGADAFRYFALVTDDSIAKEVKEERKRGFMMEAPKITLDELWKDRESNWREDILRI